MKIRYEFVDGTVSEVEVEESIGAVIIESRREEDNLARKERYHCYSMDAAQFEGTEYADNETPATQMDRTIGRAVRSAETQTAGICGREIHAGDCAGGKGTAPGGHEVN